MRVIIQAEALRRSEKTHHHQFIHELPTIDAVEVVHGRWVAEIKRMGNYSHCSECGCRCQGYVPNYKYCPNCGAKMDGGKAE